LFNSKYFFDSLFDLGQQDNNFAKKTENYYFWGHNYRG